MKVDSVMTTSVSTCVPGDTLNDAARVMWERDCGIVPIVADRNDSRVIGVITDRDICIAAYTQGRPLREIRIGDVMSKRVISCRASDEVDFAEGAMQQAQVHRLPVVDESQHLVGVLALADLARAASTAPRLGPRPEELGETVKAIRRPRALEVIEAS